MAEEVPECCPENTEIAVRIGPRLRHASANCPDLLGALLCVPVGIEENPPFDVWWVLWLANPEHAHVIFCSQPGFAGAWLGLLTSRMLLERRLIRL